MAGVIFFAKEEEEAHGAEASGDPRHGDRRGADDDDRARAGTPAGDAAAGEAVFASAGCGGCHTLEAAGASGKVGPNLDDAKPERGARDRARHERHGRDALVPGPAEREADPGRRRVRGRRHAGVVPPRYPVPRPERCPSGRRSATGNRVRVERRVAGSNPALSAAVARARLERAGFSILPATCPACARTSLRERRAPGPLRARAERPLRG